jgi:tetratricopeptide (TPR) repeat protein
VTPANFPAPRSTATIEPPKWRFGSSELTEEQKAELAKQIFLEAEALAAAGHWAAAVPLYEEAYYLVPGKHGFAYKVGEAAFAAGDCDKADVYLRHFLTYGDPDKNADKLARAKAILAEISISGCAHSP